MNQPILKQYEDTKQKVDSTFYTIKDLLHQATRVLDVAETVKGPQKKQLGSIASDIIKNSQRLANQNGEIYKNFFEITNTALRNR